ncbi:hypothetical protein PINS_up023300 [Pythium insidiosum]|nr:hypothetical protein PINS_up023300 [Pythium insidiosum]
MADDLQFERLRVSDTIKVYCAGSAQGNGTTRAQSSYACVFPSHGDLDQAALIEEVDGHDATNQRAILHAAIAALAITENYDPDARVIVISNNDYLINTMAEYINKWKAKGWKMTRNKTPKNMDLLRRLDAAVDGRMIHWKRYNNNDDKQVAYLEKAKDTAYQVLQRAP